MFFFIRSRIKSFKHALAGLWYVIKTQKNAWLHAFATLLVILTAVWLSLSMLEWAILFLTIGSVWTAEFINTALEAIVDLASPEEHPLARVGKDVGAAAVLISSFFAALIGVFLLVIPILKLLIAWLTP
ncbi:MAG: diacylglycerol kinase family protein [Anaerolineaceae bacterium]|nr:diacylglycerol kinase family protein [Anaerolineaceae bacterium]